MAAMREGFLDLTSKNISDIHVSEIVKNIKQNSYGITELNLSGNKITDNGIVDIARALCQS